MSSLSPRRPTDSGTRLRLEAEPLERMHAHAREGYPHEVVGILAGPPPGGTVARAVPLHNEREVDAARRFTVSGLTLARAEARLEAEGLEVLGYYHSHPDHPASWSDSDRDAALPDRSYVIVAVEGPEPCVTDTRAWRLAPDRSEMWAEAVELAEGKQSCC